MINNPSNTFTVPVFPNPTPPNPPAWQPQPDWVSVSGVSNNEINLLVTQSSGLAFSVWLPTGTYTIDWGDGTVDAGRTSGTTYQHQHTAGGTACAQGYYTWKVRIYGAGSQITRWKCEKSTYTLRAQFTPILWAVFGTTGNTTYANTFGNYLTYPGIGGYGLQACNIASFANCTSSYQMLYNCPGLQYVKLPSSWGSVTNVTSMFYGSPLSSITLPSSWGNVIITTGMFHGCTSLQSVTLPSSWGASLTNLTSMFNGCGALYTITLPSSWNNVTNMTNMFYNNYNLSVIDLGTSWSNTATNLTSMFYGCVGLTSVKLPLSWSGVTNTTSMFNTCTALSSITLPTSWGSVTNTTGMFNTCKNLTQITLPTSWGASLTNVTTMFNACYGLTSIDLGT